MWRLRDPVVVRRIGLVLAALGILFVLIGIVGNLFDTDNGDVSSAVQAPTSTAPAPATTLSPATTGTTAPQQVTTPSVTTTVATTTTTVVDETAARLARARTFVGTYTGEWRNLTFGSSGPIESEVTLDEEAQTLTITSDLGGNVFGGTDPDSETFMIDLAAGPGLAATSPLFGEISATIDTEGNVAVVGENIPAPGIARIELIGRVDPAGIELEYVIEFEGGGSAEGTVSLTHSTDVEAAAPSREDVEAFLALLTTALGEGNEVFLFARLHPAVFDLYGEEQCRAYTAGLEAPTLQLDVQEVTGPEPWTWERDERTTDVDDVFTVAVVRRENDAETDQELHVGVVEDELRWFTDCGDPLT